MKKGWTEVALGEVLSPVARFEERDDLKKYQFAGTYSYARGIFRNELKVGSSFNLPAIQRIEAGDFIYCKIMAWEGAFGLAGEDVHDCWMSGAFEAFRPTGDAIIPRFLQYWFKSEKNWRRVAASSTGTNVRRKSLHSDDFLKVKVSLPCRTEQQRIVAHLDAIESRLTRAQKLREEAIAEGEALLLSELTATFNREAQRQGTTKLGDLLIEAGYGSSEKCFDERTEGAIPVLRIPNIASGRISLRDLKYAELDIGASERLLVSEGDVLVVRTNGSLKLVGRSAVVPRLDEPLSFASYLIRLRFDLTRITPEFGQRMLQHLRVTGALVDFARTTAGQYNVSLGRLRGAEIPVPPIEEQNEIVREIDRFEARIDALNRRQSATAAELNALLPALFDRLFNA